MVESFSCYPISTVYLDEVWEHVLNVNHFDIDESRRELEDYAPLFFWSEGFGTGWW